MHNKCRFEIINLCDLAHFICVGPDLNTALPDVVSDQSLSRTLTSSQQESGESLLQSTRKSDPTHHPLSQSSPSFGSTKTSDATLTRLSAAFQRLHPSSSFDELATITESQVGVDQLHSEVFQKGSEEKEVDEKGFAYSSANSKDELPSCASIDSLPQASSTRTSGSRGSGQGTRATIDQFLPSQVSNSSSMSTRSLSSVSSFSPFPNPVRFISATSALSQDSHLYPPLQPNLAFIPAASQVPQPITVGKNKHLQTVFNFILQIDVEVCWSSPVFPVDENMV